MITGGNTVVSPMGLVNGKAVTLDLCISETAKRNLTKIGTSIYVVGSDIASINCSNILPPSLIIFTNNETLSEIIYRPNGATEYIK